MWWALKAPGSSTSELALTLETASRPGYRSTRRSQGRGGKCVSTAVPRSGLTRNGALSTASAGASSRGSPDSVRGCHGRGLTKASRRSGPDRAAEGAESRRGSTLHHRGPHRRERPQGDGPDRTCRQATAGIRQGSMETGSGAPLLCAPNQTTGCEPAHLGTLRCFAP